MLTLSLEQVFPTGQNRASRSGVPAGESAATARPARTMTKAMAVFILAGLIVVLVEGGDDLFSLSSRRTKVLKYFRFSLESMMFQSDKLSQTRPTHLRPQMPIARHAQKR